MKQRRRRDDIDLSDGRAADQRAATADGDGAHRRLAGQRRGGGSRIEVAPHRGGEDSTLDSSSNRVRSAGAVVDHVVAALQRQCDPGAATPASGPAPAPRISAAPKLVQRSWEDNGRGQWVWRPPPAMPTPADIAEAESAGALIVVPDIGKRQGGGRGFWGPGGAHQTHSVPPEFGGGLGGQAGPTSYPGAGNVTVDYGALQVEHHGVPPQPAPSAAAAAAGGGGGGGSSRGSGGASSGSPAPAPAGIPPLSGDAVSYWLDQAALEAGASEPRDSAGGVMKQSADDAYRAAGMPVPEGGAHHMHLQAHSHGGKETPSNFMAGAGGANQRHRVVEKAAAEAAQTWGPLPVTALPSVADAAHHVGDSLGYHLGAAANPEPAPNPQTFSFDLGDGTMPRTADQDVVQQMVDLEQAYMTTWIAFGEDIEIIRAALGPADAAQIELWARARGYL